MLIDTGGNKAAGSAAMSVATACPTTETLSSLGDDSSEDEAPSGKGTPFHPHLKATTTMMKAHLIFFMMSVLPRQH